MCDDVRNEHFRPPPRSDAANANTIILEHIVEPYDPERPYMRRSVVGQATQKLRVIMHNRSGFRTASQFMIPYGSDVESGNALVFTPDPSWWSAVDEQALFLRDAINAREIRTFRGTIAITELSDEGPDWLRHLFLDFLYALWPALWPLKEGTRELRK